MPAISKPSFVEKVNKLALEYCIENFKTLPIRQAVKDDTYTYTKLLEYYNRLDSEGKTKITYKQVNSLLDRSRWFSNGASLQNIPREIRHTISSQYYHDIDIVNAHPVLLQQICHNKGILCPNLDNYITNRNILFTELALDRDTCKKLTLSIMNGGKILYNNYKGKYDWLDNFTIEMQQIITTISKLDVDEFKNQKRRRMEQGRDYNYEGSYVNCLLCKAENQILEAMAEYIENAGWTIGTYMFDGLTIYKKQDIHTIPVKLLAEITEYVQQKTGYIVDIVEKIMDEGFTIPSDYAGEYKKWKASFEEKVAFVTHFSGFLIRNSDATGFNIKSRDQLRCIYEPQLDNLTKWLKDPLRKTYETIDFIPRPLESPSNIFNTYNNFAIEKYITDNNDFKCEPFKKLINTLMNHEPESIDYFTKWLAHLIQYPGKKNNVAIIIQSVPGVGKGLLYTILSNLLGIDYCISSADPTHDLFCAFNKSLSNKLLINLNESKEEDTMKYIELIKSYITEDRFQIRIKGKESYTIRNFARWLFFTNRDIPIKFQPGQRRFWGINADPNNANNKEWLQDIIDIIDDQYALYSFYIYLKNIDIEDFDFINNRPRTRFMKDIEEISQDKITEFIALIKKQEATKIIHKGYIKFKSTEWYNKYKAYCKINNDVDKLNQKTFTIRICAIPGFEKYKKREANFIIYTPSNNPTPDTSTDTSTDTT